MLKITLPFTHARTRGSGPHMNGPLFSDRVLLSVHS